MFIHSGTPETRRAAAIQIGEAAAVRPDEDVSSFLRRLSILLQRANWETRVAAGEALDQVIGAVAEGVFGEEVGSKRGGGAGEEVGARQVDDSRMEGRLSLRQLDIDLILTKGMLGD